MDDERKSWSRSEVFDLIQQWTKAPELWDPKHSKYRCRTYKSNVLKCIASRYDTSIMEISRKMHNLRTQYNDHARKLQKRSGPNVKASWDFFEAMKCIMTGDSSGVSQEGNEVEANVGNDSDAGNIKKENHTNEEFIYIEEATLFDDSNITAENYSSNDRHEENQLSCSEEIPSKKPRIKDDFQIFGDFVASELRSIRNYENQRRLKRKIMTAILEIYELEENK